MHKDQAINILRRLVSKIDNLKRDTCSSSSFRMWLRSLKLALVNIFGEDSKHTKEFENITFSATYDRSALSDDPYGYAMDRYKKDTLATYSSGLATAKDLLESMIEEIQDYWQAEDLAPPQAVTNVESVNATSQSSPKHRVFLGHGRSSLWARLKIFLQDELGLEAITYESESRVGESIIPILEKMLDQVGFAIIVLTAEDETSEGLKRARQNVVHEAGLFQGRLGFKRAVVIRQEGLEDFTNVAGLQYIGFSGDKIEDAFYELQRVLKREGIVDRSQQQLIQPDVR